MADCTHVVSGVLVGAGLDQNSHAVGRVRPDARCGMVQRRPPSPILRLLLCSAVDKKPDALDAPVRAR